MKIKDGYNNRPTHIRVGSPRDRVAELWIEQEALKPFPNMGNKYETLAYITLDELLDLKDEITSVIKEMVK